MSIRAPATRVAGRPPASPQLVYEDPEKWLLPVDWSSWYLTDEDDMGESCLHDTIIRLLASILQLFVERRGWSDAYVGSDTFFGWIESEPLVRISPDVYLMRHPEVSMPKSWQVWKPGHKAPDVAFEIVSEDWAKDYDEIPQKYALLGAKELVIFDPGIWEEPKPAPRRVAFQVFRRLDDGVFLNTERGAGPVWIEGLEAAAVAVETPTGPRLRLAWDREGEDLVPTPDEAAREADRAKAKAERAALEADRAKAKAERAALEADRAKAKAEQVALEADRAKAKAEQVAREQSGRASRAEAEIAALREELERLRRAGP